MDYSGSGGLAANLDGIAHVLRDRRLAVPRYQRSYSWEVEQVETFWSDLRAASMMAAPDYFLGTVVLSAESGRRASTIIDGQQRLATAALLLAALRDEFRAAGEDTSQQAIQSEYLSFISLSEGGATPRLTLNTYDADLYRQIALGAAPSTPAVASSQRLLAAYEFLKAKIRGEVEAAGVNWRKRLIEWSDFLEVHARVIVLDVPSPADAFLIFETLNDRGLALTVADLLKNYLFGVSGSDIAEVELPWDRMLATLDAFQDEQRALDYLRHYWSSWYGATRERDLYRSFRNRIRSPSQAVEIVSNLASASSGYYALVSGAWEQWPAGTVTREEAETLALLSSTQSRPLFLAAIDHFEPLELALLVRSVINWTVRGFVYGGTGGGTAEKYYSDSAVRIRAGQIRTTSAVLDSLGSLVPSDEQFSAAVEIMSAPQAQMTRYMLLAFDAYRSGTSQRPALISADSYATASVLKLPVFPYLIGVSNDTERAELSSWSRRFGNYILTERRLHLRNAETWDELQLGLSASTFSTTREISNYQNWSQMEIRDRQIGIAAAATSIWPRI